MYTTSDAVRDIIEVIDTIKIDVFIRDAAGIMNDVIGTTILTAQPAMAERVNRWLAAHLIASGPDPRIASETAKGITEIYQFKLGRGLATTMYGTQAMLNDSTGKLAAWSKTIEDGTSRKASISWLGTAAPTT